MQSIVLITGCLIGEHFVSASQNFEPIIPSLFARRALERAEQKMGLELSQSVTTTTCYDSGQKLVPKKVIGRKIKKSKLCKKVGREPKVFIFPEELLSSPLKPIEQCIDYQGLAALKKLKNESYAREDKA
mgnify:CR=1 FL=1